MSTTLKGQIAIVMPAEGVRSTNEWKDSKATRFGTTSYFSLSISMVTQAPGSGQVTRLDGPA